MILTYEDVIRITALIKVKVTTTLGTVKRPHRARKEIE